MKTKIYPLKNFTLTRMICCMLVMLWLNPLKINAQQDKKILDALKYNELKEQGKLTGNEQFVHYESNIKNPLKITSPLNRVQTGGNCDCWIQRDTSWQIVPFDGVLALPPDYRNDDYSSDTIVLPFSFCFYNSPVNNVFINNNGNISIGSAFSTYTATPFPNIQYEMIAPLWSDVDTRNLTSGLVYYKLTPQYLIIQWDSVGYFNTMADKLNSYQLIISNGLSEVIPHGNNISFCYRDMQWTTGSASGGINGFGGTPATAGVNKGDGTNYLQLGLFDQPGAAYDGPFGSNDGIDALDNQYFYFNVCDSAINIAPIIHASEICDTVTIYVGDSIFLDADYLSPEAGQITTISYITNAPSGVSVVSNTTGNTASIVLRFLGQVTNLGYNAVQFTGTDNGVPPKSSASDLVVNVINVPIGIQEIAVEQFSIYPNPANENIHVRFNTPDMKNISVTLTDQLGKTVYHEAVDESNSRNELVISSARLSKGIYFLTVKDDKQSTVKRIEVIHP